VVSVNLNLYPRPIPTPIENLRPSRETCEQCHWPLKFTGERLLVKAKYAEDETNTESKTVLLMYTGGLHPLTREPRGNHGVHLQPDTEIYYLATDDQRQQIPYVQYRRPDGEVIEYVDTTQEKSAGHRPLALDGLHGLPQPPHAHLPAAGVGAGRGAGGRRAPALAALPEEKSSRTH
jgi:hypothetical protein